mmetsp:Transcript_3757/g.8302  ORF Transcript_3757/g.8302 Transcript_3757/m.8302 type:complete len:84 (+) Transcript_3757:220-471(+)
MNIYQDPEREDDFWGGRSHGHKKNSGGLGTVVKFMKKATVQKAESAGKRKPLGDVSKGNKILQSKAASKEELKKIQSKLTEMC